MFSRFQMKHIELDLNDISNTIFVLRLQFVDIAKEKLFSNNYSETELYPTSLPSSTG